VTLHDASGKPGDGVVPGDAVGPRCVEHDAPRLTQVDQAKVGSLGAVVRHTRRWAPPPRIGNQTGQPQMPALNERDAVLHRAKLDMTARS